MNNYYKIYLSVLFSFTALYSLANFNYDDTAKKIHNEILNLNKIDIVVNKEDGVSLWLESYHDFVEITTTSKVIDVNYIISKIHKNISIIEQLDANNPFYYYCSADLHLFLSFLYFEQEEFVNSLYQFVKAKNLIKVQQHDYPNFKFADKHKLVLFFANSFIYQQIGFSSMSNADLQKQYGDLLNEYLKSADGVFYRELKLLGILLASYQSGSDANLIINEFGIDLDYAKNGPIETYVTSFWYKKAGNYSNQLSVLDYSIKSGFQNRFNVLRLRYGNALLNRQNDSSIIYLNRFLYNQKRREFVQYARFKASLYWFVKGSDVKSDSLNTLIKQSGMLVSYEDKQAVYEIKNAYNWKVKLILARTLFDGGNYIKARDVLLTERENVHNYNREQKLEYSYRMGRVYDKLNDMINATKFYQMVISSGFDDRFYYPAYASYYLGSLYLAKGDVEMADRYFRICVKLDSPIYKSSIHKKAKSLMNL